MKKSDTIIHTIPNLGNMSWLGHAHPWYLIIQSISTLAEWHQLFAKSYTFYNTERLLVSARPPHFYISLWKHVDLCFSLVTNLCGNVSQAEAMTLVVVSEVPNVEQLQGHAKKSSGLKEEINFGDPHNIYAILGRVDDIYFTQDFIRVLQN